MNSIYMLQKSDRSFHASAFSHVQQVRATCRHVTHVEQSMIQVRTTEISLTAREGGGASDGLILSLLPDGLVFFTWVGWGMTTVLQSSSEEATL